MEPPATPPSAESRHGSAPALGAGTSAGATAPSHPSSSLICTRSLSKTFRVHRKQPGLMGSIRALLRREVVVKEAVRGVDLDVAEGEILGLVGPNGAGKTTLVKMLAGIIHPGGGTARVLGFDPWKRDNDFRRQIALIMGQKAQLWWDLPAADSFLLLKEIYRIPTATYERTLAELSRLLEVEALLNLPLRRLSLGERMKMEIVGALLHEPRVVFLDEPTIGLDLTAQRTIRDFLLTYRDRHRPAMLLTSHYMEDIERLCHRIVIIREGAFVFDGPLREIRDHFARTKVLEARIRQENLTGAARDLLAPLGEVLEATEGWIRMRVPREQVAEASALLLSRFSVVDLGVHEEDIGTLIERILRAGMGRG